MTAQELIKEFKIRESGNYTANGFKPDGRLYVDDQRGLTEATVAEIKEKKSEIMQILVDERLAKEAKAKRRKDAINAIEGLKEIKDAMRDLSDWYGEFEKSFEDVGGLGVRPRPKHDIKALREKYPRADAYLEAEEYANKYHFELSEIGKKALEEVIFGDYKNAMEQMQRELDAFAAHHAWD